MASILTQNTIRDIYNYLFKSGYLVGTTERPSIVTQDGVDNIHKGIGFDVSGIGTLANNASAIFMANVGSLPLHFNGFEVSASAGATKIEIFESPTTTANGTAITPLNKNRSSTRTSLTSVYFNPTVSANGTLLATRQILSIGGGAHTEGGGTGISSEWVLKPNTKYIVKITNLSGSTITYASSFYYYEKTI